jgi:N utilization substance protein B
MGNRHQVRELAMQVLFLWDTQGQNDSASAQQLIRDVTGDEAMRQQALELAQGAWEQRQASDRWAERVAPQWPANRQPAVDRNILRLATYELINTTTPPKVVIDEAIELAKHFSTEQSAGFVNGVMDAILKEHRALTSAKDGM